MDNALYGPDGFYRRGEVPAEHFRTSVHASTQFAAAIGRLVLAVDELLGRQEKFDIVDVGAGQGELLSHLRDELPSHLVRRANLVGVEVRRRPTELDSSITWQPEIPNGIVGVLLANEWLDNIPIDVVRRRSEDRSPRYVLVDTRDGLEELGPELSDEDRMWLERWWPLPDADADAVAEIGTSRDQAWASAVASIDRGLALAIDYSHTKQERQSGRFSAGTLVGFRNGQLVTPIPDGSCDITAHVAIDSCLTAGETSGATESVLTTQGRALRSLGIDAGRPPVTQAETEPAAYVAALSRASEAAELIDAGGLGAFGWLAQAKGISMPLKFSQLNDDAKQ